MNSIHLYSTLTREKEPFEPLTEGSVSMYTCGPTVYDYAHIGNLRSFVFADTLRRMFEASGYSVKHVMNITDVGQLESDADEGEDKMTKGLRREGKPVTLEAMREFADFYTDRFLEDLIALNVRHPHVLPKASLHIDEDIGLIKTLEKKGFAYTLRDGVYFDTSKSEGYGSLARLDIKKLKEGARVEANPEKRTPSDFALWKTNEKMGWESPWGRGFPGWHIECSAMAMKYLGPSFDIHTGGTDLAPIHHTNEIAQSEAATGRPFVKYWLHSAFVNVAGGKMAKSEGNFLRLQTLIERGIHPLAYRYWLLTAHYRSQVSFTWGALEGAQTALERLARKFHELPESAQKPDDEYDRKFMSALHDDLDTPRALTLVWEVADDDSLAPESKHATLTRFLATLGLDVTQIRPDESLDITTLSTEIQELVRNRESARREKNWGEADRLRNALEEKGFAIEDSSRGPLVRPLE